MTGVYSTTIAREPDMSELSLGELIVVAVFTTIPCLPLILIATNLIMDKVKERDRT